MYVCLLNCIYVCMYACMYVEVCILFNISHYLSGSLVSVGVGPWYCVLKGSGSIHLCVLRELCAGIVSWGGGG
jgi:hypothetical protein